MGRPDPSPGTVLPTGMKRITTTSRPCGHRLPGDQTGFTGAAARVPFVGASNHGMHLYHVTAFAASLFHDHERNKPYPRSRGRRLTRTQSAAVGKLSGSIFLGSALALLTGSLLRVRPVAYDRCPRRNLRNETLVPRSRAERALSTVARAAPHTHAERGGG